MVSACHFLTEPRMQLRLQHFILAMTNVCPSHPSTSHITILRSMSSNSYAFALPVCLNFRFLSTIKLPLRRDSPNFSPTLSVHEITISDERLCSFIVYSSPSACRSGSPDADLSSSIMPHPGRRRRTQSHPLIQKYPTCRSSPQVLEPLHWVNLTNGVEMLPALSSQVPNHLIRFTRIQSSHCEAGAYDKLLQNVDNDMLLSLAVGRPCLIYDLASRNKNRGVSRALFLGLQFIRWAIAYLWFAADPQTQHLVPSQVSVRGKNAVPFWRQSVLPYRVAKDTKKRIRYFMPYVSEMNTKNVQLCGIFGVPTSLDGCIAIHSKFIRDWVETQAAEGHAERSTVQLDIPGWLSRAGFAVFDGESTCDELRELQNQLIGFANTDNA